MTTLAFQPGTDHAHGRGKVARVSSHDAVTGHGGHKTMHRRTGGGTYVVRTDGATRERTQLNQPGRRIDQTFS